MIGTYKFDQRLLPHTLGRQETTPLTSPSSRSYYMHLITTRDTPGFQGLVPLARLSAACFRRLPLLNHRHCCYCCHLKFAGRFFLCSSITFQHLNYYLCPLSFLLVLPLYSFHYYFLFYIFAYGSAIQPKTGVLAFMRWQPA